VVSSYPFDIVAVSSQQSEWTASFVNDSQLPCESSVLQLEESLARVVDPCVTVTGAVLQRCGTPAVFFFGHYTSSSRSCLGL
jgi:hypothetical protein